MSIEAARQRSRSGGRQARAEREARGEDMSFDVLDLWYHDDEPAECAEWFTAHGWTTQVGGQPCTSSRGWAARRDDADR